TVAEGYQDAAGRNGNCALAILGVFEEPDNRAAFIERLGLAVENEKWGEVAGVGIGEELRLCVVHGVEERGVAVVGRVAEEVLIQAGNEGRRAAVAIEDRSAAQGGLEAGHQQSRGDSLAADVGEGHGNAGGAEADEIVVVAANNTGGTADGGQLQAGNAGKLAREKLAL